MRDLRDSLPDWMLYASIAFVFLALGLLVWQTAFGQVFLPAPNPTQQGCYSTMVTDPATGMVVNVTVCCTGNVCSVMR